MPTINALRAEKTSVLSRMQTLAERTELSEEEEKQFDDLKGQAEKLTRSLNNVEYLQQQTAEQNKPQPLDVIQAKRSYSLQRAIAHRIEPNSVDAGLELEVEQELRSKSKRPLKGIPVPREAMTEQRALSTTTPSAGPGSRIVDTMDRPDLYVDLLRANLISNQLGVTMLTGLSSPISFPRAKSDGTNYWVGESADITASDMEFDTRVELSPKTLGSLTRYSSILMLESNPSVEMLIRRSMAQSIARGIDSAVIQGTGTSGQPTGFMTEYTASSQSGTTTNGKKPTLADLVALKTSVANANAETTMAAWLINPTTAYDFATTLKFSSAGSDTIFSNGMLLNQRTVVSTLVPSNLTKGTASNCSLIAFGVWADIILAYWGELEILVNPYGDGYASGDVQVRAMVHLDVGYRRDGSTIKFYSDAKTS